MIKKRSRLNTNLRLFILLVLGASPHRGFSQEPVVAPFPEHRFVTRAPEARDMWPCFSPDSRTLVFSRTVDGGKTWTLFTVPVAGGEATPLRKDSPLLGTRANWSRTGNRIAFNGRPSSGRFDVSLIDADGSGLLRLRSGAINDLMSYPSWYPDGKRLAVVDFTGGGSALKKIDLETGTAVALTDSKTFWAGVPRVSPDGSRIVLGGQENRGQAYSQYRNQIWILEQDGSLRRLDSKRGWAPFWSPGGERITFASDRNSPKGRSAVFVASLKGPVIRQRTPLELDAAHPTWSPDGKHIAFSGRLSEQGESRGLAVFEVPVR